MTTYDPFKDIIIKAHLNLLSALIFAGTAYEEKAARLKGIEAGSRLRRKLAERRTPGSRIGAYKCCHLTLSFIEFLIDIRLNEYKAKYLAAIWFIWIRAMRRALCAHLADVLDYTDLETRETLKCVTVINEK